MKPLNQPERRTRLWQFTLFYLVALLIPLGASYYLFSSNSLGDENARLKHELELTHKEQGQLVIQVDSLTRHLQRVNGIDQQMRNETNQVTLSKLDLAYKDNLNDIDALLSQLRLDSAHMEVPSHRRLVRGILRDFDLFRANRSTIDLLRQDVDKSGNAAKGNESLRQELAQSKQESLMLRAMLNSRPPAGGGGGGGGGTPPVVTPSNPARQQLALLQDRIDFANADCLRQRALDKKARSKERHQLLEASRTAFIQILQDPATPELKESIEKTLEPMNIELGRPPRFFGLL